MFFLFCSLLKKVTKEHLKDDFDSLFKHLSSNEKSVTIKINLRDHKLNDFSYNVWYCGFFLPTVGDFFSLDPLSSLDNALS